MIPAPSMGRSRPRVRVFGVVRANGSALTHRRRAHPLLILSSTTEVESSMMSRGQHLTGYDRLLGRVARPVYWSEQPPHLQL